MFIDSELNNILDTSPTIKAQSAVIAEWNMNMLDNVAKLGNYRFRKSDGIGQKYYSAINNYDPQDSGYFYKDATYADILVNGGIDSTINESIFFKTQKENENLLYSLEDCLGRFRPRSGINKARFGVTKYLHHSNQEMFNRPRFYMADRNDRFKYWTSYRTEDGIERGIANKVVNGRYLIDDAAPFVVYKEPVPANRIIVKMQTGVGTTDLGQFRTQSGSINDPFFGYENQATPVRWKIQYLENNNWIDAVSFDEGSSRSNGDNIIGTDGYVELAYGLMIPEQYKDIFLLIGEVSSASFLPEESTDGHAFIVKSSIDNSKKIFIWINQGYTEITPTYGWYLEDGNISQSTNFVTEAVNHKTHNDPISQSEKFDEFMYISGIRIVIETMNKFDSTFDLIEMSPRLVVDLSGKTSEYSVKKMASDLGISGLPVGQLLASTGSMTIFDYDEAFNINNSFDHNTNTGSIIAKYLNKNLQIKLYEVIFDNNFIGYFVPIKTMYSDGFPQNNSSDRSVNITLRDLYFYFESTSAPDIVVQDVSLSYAVSLLFDSIGFSNYTFKRLAEESDPVIQFFYSSSKQSVAEVLQQLAISTQTAMFFDEINNFVLMSKDYMLPEAGARSVDLELSGTSDTVKSGGIKNINPELLDENGNISSNQLRQAPKLSNIIEVASQDNNVYNDGKITYTTRYIQKSYGTIKQAYLLDRDKSWIYKPALLWEVSGSGNVRSVNDEAGTQEKYNLSAIPLSSDLSSNIPVVENGQVVNNIIDLGEAVYWIPRYSGYFYANGEVIKFDAIEYSVSPVGNVWITSTLEYQNYFSKISFNGKIYPTGRVRIYSEPNYEILQSGETILKNGAVAKHGRGQFGTSIVSHSAGLATSWSSNDFVRGINMESKYLFNDSLTLPTTSNGSSGVDSLYASKTTRTGIIKNFLSHAYAQESEASNYVDPDGKTVQSSALVMNGREFSATESPIDYVSYVYKPMAQFKTSFKHFGTRLRIIGKVENSDTKAQTPTGGTTYFTGNASDPSQNTSISGGSGGIAVLVNPDTNQGYYFEIAALSENNLEQYENSDNIKNVMFYKIKSGPNGKAIPVQLNRAGTKEVWPGALSGIIVDSGTFTGQSRIISEEVTTVYDLAVEYEDVGSVRRFYLYINNVQIATLDDPDPITVPANQSAALFVRGSSRLMFENIYALANNYSSNTGTELDTIANSVFSNSKITTVEAFRKYAISGVIQSSYLSGISASGTPTHNIYYDEFGTIMREAAYFNVRYQAYPALYSKISPTFNSVRGYTVSGYFGGSYGAEFLVFNSTDTSINLDETTGNHLRIQGITFTNAAQNELTVDEYFSKKSDLSNPILDDEVVVSKPLENKKDFYDIKISRATYGKNEFTLDAPYIQSQDSANDMMGWIISKIMKPRKSVGVKIFANPTIQLGDLVRLTYVKDGVNQISSNNDEFVVYSIEYSRGSNGPSMTVYLSEVA